MVLKYKKFLCEQGASMLRHEKYVVKSKWDKVKDNIKGFFSAVLIALLIRIILIEPYKIPTGSMYPTILEGDMIMANKFWYGVRVPVINLKLPGFSSPDVGNIILFETPTYESPGKFTEFINFITFGIFNLDNTHGSPKYFIKRVIGTPGDSVRLVNPKSTEFKYHLVINKRQITLKPAEFKEDFPEHEMMKKKDFDFFYEELEGKGEKHFVQFEKGKYQSPDVLLPNEVYGLLYVPKDGDTISFSIIAEDSHDERKALIEARDAKVPARIHPLDKVKIVVKDEDGKIKEFIVNGKIINSLFCAFGNSAKEKMNQILTSNDLYELILDAKTITKTIDEDFYFVMGDNRDGSSDSRVWGFVNESLIIGNPLFRHYPFSRFGKVDRIED